MTRFFKNHAVSIGALFVVLYALCVLYAAVITDAALAELHLNQLRLAFPGFRGYDAGSIIWGGILSFIYGFIFSHLFHAFHGKCCRGE